MTPKVGEVYMLGLGYEGSMGRRKIGASSPRLPRLVKQSATV
jgi:hypothetical protein